MSSHKQPIRLPALKVLRVRNPNRTALNPCIGIMSSVLACWASTGYNSGACAAVEQALRACTDKPGSTQKTSNSINYHLMRFASDLTEPTKKGKKKKR